MLYLGLFIFVSDDIYNRIKPRRKNILYTKRLIELAQGLGGKVLVWGSGRSRNIPGNIPFETGYGWLVELLRASAYAADQTDVKVAVEPLNRFKSTVMHDVSEALSLAKLVNRKSIGVVYDTFHTNPSMFASISKFIEEHAGSPGSLD
jgi:D-psicose/D-tagatose/L-ribulose 3-epimerase